MSDLLGFEQIEKQLFDAFSKRKLPHALIISGKKGSGKASFSKNFAFKITNSNPDILVIEKDDEKREITVDKIRNIKDFVNQTSAISKEKFIIIDSACELNKSGSNALLKILEEPQKDNFLILIAHNINRVLPTIRSRCQTFKNNDLSRDQFAKIIKNNVDFLSEICDQSPAQAINSGAELARFYELFLRSILNRKLNEELLKKAAEKTYDFSIIERSCEFFFCRMIKFLSRDEFRFFFEEEKVFLTIKPKFSAEELFQTADESMILLHKTTSLYLDKKITLLNIFNKICRD